MPRPHRIDRVKAGALAAGQQPPHVQARNLGYDREHATLCLNARREADDAEQSAGLKCRVKSGDSRLRRPEADRLWVQMAPDQHLGVIEA